MVRGFVLLTLGRGRSRVLYSRLFAAEGSPGEREAPDPASAPAPDQVGLGLQRSRLREKEQLTAVARQVSSSCVLARQAADKPLYDSGAAIGEEPIGSLEPDLGVFRLSAAEIFTEEAIVVWMGVLSLGFALICDTNENLMLAENTLRLLVKYFKEHLKLLIQSNDVVLKTDRIEAILNTFLPHGQLMFLNCCFIQSLEKELNASMFK
ncbi:AP-5 complex subunit sigma-1 [Pristis pectinata]|uniref:AP-5 complex subunit sigma-1 n=1 Tax=Pristis pectinata TaxID=685728 RepID=UPI00223E5085|nr:AP-5 complex subunit sigma-1 [Pristis pectinata]